MRLAVATILAMTFALPALTQEKLSETLEVRVVNVDVVVRDRAGNPVTGLTKDDFELFDNGKKQDLTNLYEVRPPAATASNASPASPASVQNSSPSNTAAALASPVELRPRKLIVMIDNYSIHPFRRNAVFKSLQKFIDREMRPEDEAMIVVFTQDVKVARPFTSDKAAIRTALAELSLQSSSGSNDQADIDQVKKRTDDLIDSAKGGGDDGPLKSKTKWKDAYSMALGEADAYAEHASHQAVKILDALGRTVTAVSGVEGKKVLVFAGANLPERPGAALYQFIYNEFLPNWPVGDADAGELRMPTGSFTGRSSGVHYSIDATAKQASAAGVTLYMIDASDQRDNTSAERTPYSVSGAGFGGGATDSQMMNEKTENFQKFASTAMAYGALARATGGVAITNTENFDLAFETLGRDLNSYYSIGYKPPTDASAQHQIVVKVRNPSYSARTRETYATRSAEEQMNDRVLGNLASETHGEWPIEIHLGTPEKAGDRYKVPVQVSLAPNLTLLPQDGQLGGGFTLYIAVGHEGGHSKVTRSPQTLKIPTTAEADLRSKPMTFNAMIMVAPGESVLSIGVVDQVSAAVGFARARVVAQ